MKQLVKILDDIQKGESEHLKLLLTTQKLYNKNKESFKTEFIPLLQRVLVASHNDASLDRIISFISKFTSKLGDDDDEFIDFLIGYLGDTTRVLNKTVRLRCCQLIASVLGSLPADAEISDDVFEKLSKRMVPRLRDKVPAVRLEAVKALARLQDPYNVHDPVIAGYLKLLRADSNKEVRKAVLRNISPSAITLPHILKRARDNAADIRAIVFKLMSEVEVKQLDISQRIALLSNGLGDRDTTVKNACVTMICSWLNSNKNDPEKLLNYLLVEKFEDITEKVMKLILRNCDIEWTAPKVKRNSLPILTSESALIWRVYLSWLKKRLPKEPEVQDLLDKSAPAIPDFCNLLKAYITNEAIAKQLVGMVKYLDLSDEVRRRDLSLTLSKLLPSSRISEALKKSIMVTLKLLYSDEDAYITMILEVISEIQDPLEASQAIHDDMDTSSSSLSLSSSSQPSTPTSKRSLFVRGPSSFNLRSSSSNLRSLSTPDSPPSLRRASTAGASVQHSPSHSKKDDWSSCPSSDKLVELQNLRADFVKKQDQLAVYRIDMEIEILKSNNEDSSLSAEERRWVHCMAMTEGLLQLTSKDLQNPGIHDLLSNVILQYVAHPLPKIRERAMRCLGLFCMLSKSVARLYLYLFSQALKNDQLQIQCVVLKLLFDLLLVYGIDGFEEIESSSQKPEGHEETRKRIGDRSEIMGMLSTFLLHPSAELRAIVVEGFSKLLYSDQISDPLILSKLVVLFFLNEPAQTLDQDDKSKIADNDLPSATPSSPYAHIRQCLSVFLPAYSFQSLDHMNIVLGAFIPTIREIIHNFGEYVHDSDEDVQPAKITKVAQLFIHLTTTNLKDGASCPHNELAIKLAKEIKADPNDADSLNLCRVFKDLNLSRHSPTIKTLNFFITSLLEDIRDSAVIKLLTKFLEDLRKLDPVPEIEPTEAVLENLKEELVLYSKERQEYIDSKQQTMLPKRRVKRFSSYESDSSSSESEEEDKNTQSHVATRQVPGRRSKQLASDRLEEISMNMKSLKATIMRMNESDSESESSSKTKRKTPKKKEEEESEEEGSEDNKEIEEEDAEESEQSEHENEKSKSPKSPKGGKKKADSEDEDYVETAPETKKSPTKGRRRSTHSSDEEYASPSPSPKKKRNSKSTKSDEETTPSPSKRGGKTKANENKRKRGVKGSKSDSDNDASGGSSSDSAPKKKKGRRNKAESDKENEESTSEADAPRTRGQKKATPVKKDKKVKKVISDEEKEEEEEVKDEVVTVRRSPRKSKTIYSSKENNNTQKPTRGRGSKEPASDEEESNEEEYIDEEEEEEEEEEEKLQDSRRKKSTPQRGKKEKEKEKEVEEESENDEKKREETVRNTFINSNPPELSQVRHVVVSFSEDVPKDDTAKFVAMIEKINGKIYTGSSLFSSDITHVVEGKLPTAKTLFAIVSNRWLVSQKWVKDSALYGSFLNEKQYGTKCNNPILKKKFYLDPSFKDGDKRRSDLATSLIKVGRGAIVSSETEADIVMVGNESTSKSKGKGKKGKGKEKEKEGEGLVFQWDEFVGFLRENRF